MCDIFAFCLVCLEKALDERETLAVKSVFTIGSMVLIQEFEQISTVTYSNQAASE